MKHENYTCPKYRHTHYEMNEMRATGGTLSKIFDIPNKKFTLVTCSHSTYTEFYKTKTSTLSHIFDLFTS